MRPFQVPPLLLMPLLLAILLLLLSPEPSTAFVFPPAHRAVPSTKPSHALSPLAATATTSTSSTPSTPSNSKSSSPSNWKSSSPKPTTTTLHPVLHVLHQTASRAAPPGSTRRSLLQKVARGMLALGGGVGTAATAASAAGAAAPDRTPGKYKSFGSGGTSTLEREEQSSSGSSRSSNAADEKAKKEVLETTRVWLQTVTNNKPTAAAETSALYAKDAVLWGTVSEQLRVTPSEILNYFEFFAGLPGLRVAAYQPFVRVWGGDTAINDGYYVFAWQGPDGVEVQKHARFSFVYRREEGRKGGWMIVDHHSSLLPTAPTKLVKATTVVL